LSVLVGPDTQLTFQLSLDAAGGGALTPDSEQAPGQLEEVARDGASAWHSTALGSMRGTLSGWVAKAGQVVAVPASRCARQRPLR
jgi:hypothetical protein